MVSFKKKLFGVVPLVTGGPCTNSTAFKIHSYVKIQLYGTVTFEPLVQFQNILGRCQNINKV